METSFIQGVFKIKLDSVFSPLGILLLYCPMFS